MEYDFSKRRTKRELKYIIDTRLKELYSQASDRKVIGYEKITIHKGIIPKETLMDNGDAYFQLRDTDYLEEFLEYLQETKVTDLSQILNCIGPFIKHYFGSEGNPEQRNYIFSQHTNGSEYPDISVLKGKNVAVCSERAAISQNLFSFFGIESHYVTGEIIANGEKVSHAFNVIRYKNTPLVYDSSCDVPVYSNGQVVRYLAYLLPMSIEQEKMLFAYHTAVSLKEYHLEYDGETLKRIDTGQRVYAAGILPHHLSK